MQPWMDKSTRRCCGCRGKRRRSYWPTWMEIQVSGHCCLFFFIFSFFFFFSGVLHHLESPEWFRTSLFYVVTSSMSSSFNPSLYISLYNSLSTCFSVFLNRLFPVNGPSTILLSACPSTLLLAWSNHFSLFSVNLFFTGATINVALTFSFLVLSFFATPHILLNIVTLFTCILLSRGFVVARVSLFCDSNVKSTRRLLRYSQPGGNMWIPIVAFRRNGSLLVSIDVRFDTRRELWPEVCRLVLQPEHVPGRLASVARSILSVRQTDGEVCKKYRYINVRRSRDVFVLSFVRLIPSLHSVRFGQLLRWLST